MITDEQVALLICEGEGLGVEFKECYSSRIDRDIVAFANTRGGILLLGVCDDKTIKGETLTNDMKAKINDLARHCQPGISVHVSQIGKVVAVEVAEGAHKAYSCGEGYFRRLNGTTQKMSPDELRLMFRDNDPVPFEERTVPGFSFEDVSRGKVLAFAKEVDIPLGGTTTSDFLRSLKVADESKVANAGILFFAKAPRDYIRQAQMTMIAFKGTDRLHIYDRLDVQDDLLSQFNQAVGFLEKHLNIRSEIKGVQRKDIYEIPFEALREGLLNALMHRDYSIAGTQVSVDIFDDRVEITNPGGLAKGLTQKALGKGLSIRRNELIADLFSRLHMVERAGSGIRRMKRFLAEAGLQEPQFEIDGFFRAVFRRSPEFALKASTTAKEAAETAAQKTTQIATQKTTQKILTAIAANPKITRKELAQHLGITADGIKYHLRQMQRLRVIQRVGPDKGGRWEILK